MSENKFTPKFKVWLEVDGKRVIGDQEAQILEGIQKLGSFIATAKAIGISYSHAWNTIDNISKTIGAPMVEARKGGKYGGGAKLTEAGLNILKKYQELEKQADNIVTPTASPERQEIFATSQLPDFIVIGSDCVGIDLLVNMMEKKKAFNYEIVKVGSSGGLAAIMLGEADVAGIHLYDEESGQYNTPFLKRYWISDKAVIIRGYLRDQGLVVAGGNPKKVRGISDLIRQDIRMVNRSLGSGTRTLLDMYLRKEMEKRGFKFREVASKVKGYSVEMKSHSEIAEAVLGGEADVGLGIKAVAVNYKLDFIPIAQENFDFAVEETRLKKPLVKQFFEELESSEFSEKVKGLGLHTTRDTGKIIYRP